MTTIRMSNIAFVFPGQGSQYVGMGVDLARAWDPAYKIFKQGSEVIGFNLDSICWNGSKEQLDLTEYTQPAILATSIAIHEILIGEGVRPRMVAGHSLGEYTAIVSAGGLAFGEALSLVQKRGRYMQEAVQPGAGAMAAILGLSKSEIEKVCRKAQSSGIVSPANYNSPGQIVIAGEKKAVEVASQLAREEGAKRIIPLAVSVPSHCRLMRTAAQRLAKDLETVTLQELKIPLVTNVHARVVTQPSDVQEALIQQLESPVQWVESVTTMREQGITTFIEVGPGKVLSGLIKRIVRDANIFNVEDTESLDKTLSALIVKH